MSPTHLPLLKPDPSGPLGRMQMLLTVGTGAVLLVLVIALVVVAEQTLTVVLVGVSPPIGGFLLVHSFLLHLPLPQLLPQ